MLVVFKKGKGSASLHEGRVLKVGRSFSECIQVRRNTREAENVQGPARADKKAPLGDVH